MLYPPGGGGGGGPAAPPLPTRTRGEGGFRLGAVPPGVSLTPPHTTTRHRLSLPTGRQARCQLERSTPSSWFPMSVGDHP